MPLESSSRIVSELASRGYNAEREAVTLLVGAPRPRLALDAAIEHAPDDALRITTEHVRAVLDGNDEPASVPDVAPDAASGDSPNPTSGDSPNPTSGEATDVASGEATDVASGDATDAATDTPTDAATAGGSGEGDTDPTNPSISTGTPPPSSDSRDGRAPVETKGSDASKSATRAMDTAIEGTIDDTIDGDERVETHDRDPSLRQLTIANDMTGRSTGTGEYDDFVTTFRDRYERLSKVLRGRVNHRPAKAIASMPGGSEAAMIGLVNDVRSTKSGHWLVELEDTTGTFPALIMKDRDIADAVDELLMDECIAVEGTLADDGGILFADSIHFPDIPRTHRPRTADRHVQAALISDVHVGSDEFMEDAWQRFTSWLHTEEASAVEYLLLAGDMVEGVGVYPNQDEELEIIDIYEQYEAFSEYLKEVPGDMEIVMIPGNHDAVRLAEPQPGFDEELRGIMTAHDARIVSNPATVTVENVSVLMYHGVSLDEVIAELPAEKASYEEPHKAMYQLLKKRHVAPQFGGHTRVAPEERDYLVIDDVPDVFHTGHVHKLGWGKYHNVLAVNSGCWQSQTDFQKSVNIQPDSGYAPILDLDTLEMTVRKFA